MQKRWVLIAGHAARHRRVMTAVLMSLPIVLIVALLSVQPDYKSNVGPGAQQVSKTLVAESDSRKVLSESTSTNSTSTPKQGNTPTSTDGNPRVTSGTRGNNKVAQTSSSAISSDRLILSKNSVVFSVHTFSEDLSARLESGRKIYYLQSEAGSAAQGAGIVTIGPYIHDLQTMPFKAHAFSLPAPPGDYDIPVVARDSDGNELARANLHIRALPTSFSVRVGAVRTEVGVSLVSLSFVLEGENGYRPYNVEFSPTQVPNGFTCDGQTNYTFAGYTLYYAGDAPNRTQISRVCQDVAGASSGMNTFTYEFHDRYGTSVTKSVSVDYRTGR